MYCLFSFSHIWVVCIRNRDDNLGNPDSDYPNNDTFGFYGDAGDGVPYIVSEFGVDAYPLPRDFRVGDTSEANDFPTIYVNGQIDGDDVLDCFIRYFITLDDVSGVTLCLCTHGHTCTRAHTHTHTHTHTHARTHTHTHTRTHAHTHTHTHVHTHTHTHARTHTHTHTHTQSLM